MNEPQPGAGMGKGMMYVAWVIGLGLLTLFFNGVLERQNNPNQSPESRSSGGLTEVVLQRNRYGHYVASGAINNYPVTFLLDTGATGVDIPAHIANEIGLQRGRTFQVSTANGIANVYATEINLLSLGEIEMRDLRGSINPNVSGDTVLLGMSVLKHVEFVQQGNTLTLRY